MAREIRLSGEEAIFAPTTPLEASRTVLTAAATNWKDARTHVRSPTLEWRTQISFIEVSRAYSNAKRDPDVDPVYVDLPMETLTRRKAWSASSWCNSTAFARLLMDGTVDTPASWEKWASCVAARVRAFSDTRADASYAASMEMTSLPQGQSGSSTG